MSWLLPTYCFTCYNTDEPLRKCSGAHIQFQGREISLNSRPTWATVWDCLETKQQTKKTKTVTKRDIVYVHAGSHKIETAVYMWLLFHGLLQSAGPSIIYSFNNYECVFCLFMSIHHLHDCGGKKGRLDPLEIVVNRTCTHVHTHAHAHAHCIQSTQSWWESMVASCL